MAKTNWSSLKGKSYRISVGKTSEEAVAASESEYIFFTTDGNIVLNGTMFIPTPQNGVKGNSTNYVYSDVDDAQNDVLCGVFKVFQNGADLKLCHKIWGTGNSNYNDGKYHTVTFPYVTTSSAGVFEASMLVRLRNTTLKEVNSTTQEVNVIYPNYKDGSTQILTLSAATSAKAGVMTSEQYNQLTDLSKYQCGCLGTYTTTSAFKEALSNMPTTHKGKYGHYYAEVSGIYVYITFVSLSSDSYSQWVEGPMIKSSVDGDIYLNNELGVHIIGRVFQNGSWGYWRSNILDDELPIVATTTNDGLMSKEDKALLMKIKEKLEL